MLNFKLIVGLLVGWDGTFKGAYVAEGVYNYYISVKDGRGRTVDHYGNVMVMNYE